MKKYFEKDLGFLDQSSAEYKLKEIYDNADNHFETRFEVEESPQAGFSKIEELKLLVIQAQNVILKKEHEKLYALVMGNLHLRLAQCQHELFQPSGYNHRKAISYLGENINLENDDEINCLLLLNKGKYFRNTARPGRKSNYVKACDIFADVIQKASKLTIDESKKSHIILDAAVNMGRVQRYSYDFDAAKKIFLEIILKLKPQKDEYNKKIYKCKAFRKLLDENPDINESDNDKLTNLKQILSDMQQISEEYVTEYLLQSLVHIGIILRKKRNYEDAIEIFDLVNELDPCVSGSNKNIDAENNLGVCFRKLAELKTMNTVEGQKYYEDAKDIFVRLSEQGNNFARINGYKCELISPEAKFEKNIVELESDDKTRVNNNIKMLLARFYEKSGAYEKAETLFREIYNDFPYLTRGSIGLKAYYHVAQCKMKLKEYHQAYIILRKIKELYHKTTGEDDLLTEIDLGWCLMQKGNYGEAAAIYEALRQKDLSGLETKYLMRIYNNQCECYIHRKKFSKAEELVEEVLKKEKENRVALYFRAYLKLQSFYKKDWSQKDDKESEVAQTKKLDEDQIQKLNDICREFSDLLDYKPVDERVNSGWLIAMLNKWEYEIDIEQVKAKIIDKLKYSAEPISMKCYFKLTDFVLKNIGDETDTLYRDYCHVRLTDHRGNRAFQHLMDSPDFRYFDWKTRAHIMAYIVKVYEQILEIKKICRYTFDERRADASMPVHYTSIDTLKIFLCENSGKKEDTKGGPKLRLWNTVYMNDDFEGSMFDVLLEQLAEESGSADKPKDVREVLKRYFGSPIARDVQLDSNVYITSFSKAHSSFQMWDIYAKKGKGCAIRFDEDFFSIRDDYEDLIEDEQFAGNPLYTVQYFNPEHIRDKRINKHANKILNIMSNIWKYIEQLEELLKKQIPDKTVETEIKRDLFESAQTEIRSFVADRLNEVRYLFKTHLFQYEAELRLVRCSHKSMIDEKNFDIPRLYIEVDKRIENIDVELGNKLNAEEIKELSTWLDNTNKVKKISVAKLSNAR